MDVVHTVLRRGAWFLFFPVSLTCNDADDKYIQCFYVPGTVLSTSYEPLDLILITTLGG